MSYPEDLSNSKNLQDLLFKKEFAQLFLNKDLAKNIKTKEQQTINDITSIDSNFNINELILNPHILKENLLTLHSHQQFVRNFINPDTPYTRLLLKHATGTGKTIAALSIAMTFIKYYQLQYNLTESSGYGYTPLVYIIGFSKQIFQKELLKRPEFGFITKEEISDYKKLRYLADVGSQNDKDIYAEFESRIKKRLSRRSRGGFFKFLGYKEFFNRLFIFSYPLDNLTKSNIESIEEEDIGQILTEDQIINGLKSGSITINLELLDSFANSIIICDEIHNVYNSSEINNYGIALRILLNIYDIPDTMNNIIKLDGITAQNVNRLVMLKNSTVRALFMSATPINNSPTEIIDLLNLLIPANKLPNNKLDKSEFFEDSRNLKKDALEKIQNIIQGYVSFLRDDNPKYFPEKKFEGEYITIPNNLLHDRVNFYNGNIIPYLKFIRCPMSEYHQRTYDQIYTGTLPPDGQSLIDLVLPNPGLMDEGKNIGLFKTKDIKYSLLNTSQNWRDKNQISLDKTSNNTYIITGEFMRYENIKQYSTKYYKMLDSVFDNLINDKGKVIISHQYVKMSGVLFIQELLRKNGILDEYANPTDDTLCSKCGNIRKDHSKKHDYIPARFIIYYGELDKQTLDKSLEKYRSIENANGYYYRFLIGSKIINESIDFNAVQNMWIMVAPANIPTLLQILGRSIRKNSHLELAPDKRKVKIKIFVTSSRSDLSYEEKKYFEKSQDYLVIQLIEKIFNENSIDAIIHRNIIMPESNETGVDDLGALYFKPSNVFGKKWLNISNYETNLSLKDVSLTTFRLYHSDDEISIILYIIKRLFIEQSPVWTYNDLWNTVQNPPFELYVNPKLFLEDNLIIALNILTDYTNVNDKIDTYQIMSVNKKNHIKSGDITRLFDRYDKKILSNGDHTIVYLNGYYILFPNSQSQIDEVDIDEINPGGMEKTLTSQLGINSSNLLGMPDIDIDNCYRQSHNVENTSVRITKYLKTSNISYNQMKYKFYNQYRTYAVEDLPISVEIYDLDFHTRLVEDSIRYAFNILTNNNMPISELHEFYFKMLYFYDRLGLILFADHLENTKLISNYQDYITHSNLKIEVYDEKESRKAKFETLMEDHKYNPFLMSSILKSTERTFNINRLNDFIGERGHKNELKKKNLVLDDMNISKQLRFHRKFINKVFSNMLPVGHFLNTVSENNNILTIPKIYLPNLDSDIGGGSKTYPWTRAYEFVQLGETVNEIENDIIIGYFEKNPTGIDIKFKLRLPSHKIISHEDSRMMERGSACNTRKKEDLVKISEQLGLKITNINKDDVSIKIICNEIKLELMHREMNERRKMKHTDATKLQNYKQVRWFYLHYENQL